VIEVEKLTEVMKEFSFNASESSVTIDIGEFAVRNKTLYNDLFLIDKETSMYIDPSKYRIVFPFEIQYNPEIIDYIKSEDGNIYYYLDITEDNKVRLIQPDCINTYYNAGYVVTKDDMENAVYQLNIDPSNVSYNLLSGDIEITKHINSINDPNTTFVFNISNGKVNIEVITNDTATISEEEAVPDVIELNNIFLRCNRFVTVVILDEELYGKTLNLCIKKNFKIGKIEIQQGTDILQPISFVADMKNDRRYVRVYRNGRLVPRHIGNVRFPLDCNVGKMDVFPGVNRNTNDHVMVEIMPYMMHQVCYMEKIPDDEVIDLRGLIDKPFDFKWYDIYINGRKLVKKDVEIISANRIKILKSNSLQWLEIIENSRDKEYFGYKPLYDFMDVLFDIDKEFADKVNSSIDNMFDLEDPVIDNPIPMLDYILRDVFDNLLVKKFGLINPDENQIDLYNIKYYPEFLSEDKCFEINPDYGKGGLHIMINPDNE
jgi:hypothetical protein